jgi:hypothetical protein
MNGRFEDKISHSSKRSRRLGHALAEQLILDNQDWRRNTAIVAKPSVLVRRAGPTQAEKGA